MGRMCLLYQLFPVLLLSYSVFCLFFFFSFPHPVHHLPLFVEKPDFCFHEKDPGTCRGFFSRYFYNKETKLCEIFKYGGCLGNQNNFKSLEECQTTCQGMGNDTSLSF
uniref:Tissue factor pathway inhibitor n=1 Tax=Anser brachyrhynchus TaxID=132585 RepID=A0A8B9CNT2_9AVES